MAAAAPPLYWGDESLTAEYRMAPCGWRVMRVGQTEPPLFRAPLGVLRAALHLGASSHFPALGALPPACIPYWPVEAAEKQEQHLKLLQVGWRGFCPQ